MESTQIGMHDEMKQEWVALTTTQRILTINGGSSRVTFALFEAGDPLRRMLDGSIVRIGLPDAVWRVNGADAADNVSEDD